MRCSVRLLLYTLMALMIVCLVDSSVFAKDKESKLPPQYREWLDRDAAYRVTQRAAMAAWEERRPFLDVLRADPEVTSRLTDERLAACFDLKAALANAGRGAEAGTITAGSSSTTIRTSRIAQRSSTVTAFMRAESVSTTA